MYTTAANPGYFRQEFMDSCDYEITSENGDIFILSELDPLSPRLTEFVEKLSSFEIVEYTGQQLTTLVYERYGTTSLWWLVLLVNGMLSRTELRAGMSLRFPVFTEIRQLKDFKPPASVREVVLV